MAQQPLRPREPSKRIRRENRKYPSQAPDVKVKVKVEASEPRRSGSAAARLIPECSVPNFNNEVQEVMLLQRAQAELAALLQQTGCTSAAELALKHADMERKLASIGATSGEESEEEEESEEPEAPSVWATLQNCRGVTKQKPDDRYLQCMGLKQKHADMKHPPGLSEIVLRQPDSATRGAVKIVRLYAKSRSKNGARPNDAKAVLLMQCNVQKAANKDDIATRAANISGLSAFALGESVHLRLRRNDPSKASPGEWKGPGEFPSKWVMWQPARHKENGITVDDGIRPFSVELELDNGDKVFCVTPFRIQSTGDRIMENQLKRKREQISSGQRPRSNSTTTAAKPTTIRAAPATQNSGVPVSFALPILEFCQPEQDCLEDSEEDSEEGKRSPFFDAYSITDPAGGVSVLTDDSLDVID